jgi:hypothetical protein
VFGRPHLAGIMTIHARAEILAGSYVATACFPAGQNVAVNIALNSSGRVAAATDLVVPNHALYQAKLRPEFSLMLITNDGFSHLEMRLH